MVIVCIVLLYLTAVQKYTFYLFNCTFESAVYSWIKYMYKS